MRDVRAGLEAKAQLAAEEADAALEAVHRQQETNARALAEAAEAAKEARIERVQQRAALRLGKRELSKGWQAWLDVYLERQRHTRMLAAAAGRLARPALAAALTHWRTDWQEELRAALEEGQRILRAAHVGELEKLKGEMAAKQAKLDDERKWQQEHRQGVTAAAKVAAADVETEYQRKMAEQAEAEKEARVAHLQQMAIRRFGKAEILRGWQVQLLRL